MNYVFAKLLWRRLATWVTGSDIEEELKIAQWCVDSKTGEFTNEFLSVAREHLGLSEEIISDKEIKELSDKYVNNHPSRIRVFSNNLFPK